MGNVNGAFPLPLEDSQDLPAWVWAIVAASVGVTLLWIIAIVLLVAFEVCGSRRESYRVPQHEPSSATVFRGPSQLSLGERPPPIPAPARRSSSLSSTRSSPPAPQLAGVNSQDQLRVGGAAGAGYRESIAVPDTDPFEDPEHEYKLRAVSPDEESISSSGSSVASAVGLMSFEDSGSVKKKKPRKGPTAEELFSGAASVMTQTSLEEDRSPSRNSLAGMVLSRPVTVRQLGATIREPGYIESEFRKLPTPVVSSEDIPPGCERKNRYSNVLPTPKTRVQLPILIGRANSDFINANYIRGHKGAAKQYIATQGPMENTIEDFWRMVWEHKCEVIVMATNFQERGINKCARYWPAQGSEEYGCMEVTLVSQTAKQDYNCCTLQLRQVGSQDDAIHTVHHYRLTCWPQQGVPKTTKPIVDFLKEVKMSDSCSGPAVVHCSAGIGRTGLLIALDIGVQGLLQGEAKIDVLRVVSTLRQDRAGMVQTREQYRFIHQALYECARETGGSRK